VFFGLVIVPEDKIGLVTKFVLLAQTKIEGRQNYRNEWRSRIPSNATRTGLHWSKWVWQYSVHAIIYYNPAGSVGLVSAKDGVVPQTGRILGRRVDCDNYQDAEKI
jgi:hypothetical protein